MIYINILINYSKQYYFYKIMNKLTYYSLKVKL
jgi:hypothetical protein